MVNADTMVSVIIPCRNPGPYFRQLLESLLRQECGELWEVIVVDNRSSDGTSMIARDYLERLPIRIVDAAAKVNASYARNVGVLASQGNKLLFLDADDEIAPGYIAAMTLALESHDFVTSRVDTTSLNPEWVRRAHGPPWQDEEVMIFFNFLPSAGINIGIPRDLFDAVGGFPEDFAGSQDVVFSWRVQLKLNKPLHFVPDAVYRYRFRNTLMGLFHQTRNWGSSNVRLYSCFRNDGMPGRSVRMAFAEWRQITAGLLGARTKADVASLAVRFGYCVGRLEGSLRYRLLYL
jgi:glycosyltransferase involved in cell wall biosynthesis